MANRRLSVRKIREVLRLAFAGLELRKIEHNLGISHTMASSYVAGARAADLSWPLPESLDDTMLDRLLFPRPAATSKKEGEPHLRSPVVFW